MKKNKIILSEEDLDYFRKLDHERIVKIAKEKTSEDLNRPLFDHRGYREELTEEETERRIEEFKMTDFYDYLEKKLSSEELHEFLYGTTNWEEYLKSKKTN